MSSFLKKIRRAMNRTYRYWHFAQPYDPPHPEKGEWEALTVRARDAEEAVAIAKDWFAGEFYELTAEQLADLKAHEPIPRAPTYKVVN